MEQPIRSRQTSKTLFGNGSKPTQSAQRSHRASDRRLQLLYNEACKPSYPDITAGLPLASPRAF